MIRAPERLGLIVAVVVLAACGSVQPEPTSVERPSGAGELVVRVERVGGLLPPLDAERALPQISIYGDGLALVPAPTDGVFPGPAGHELESMRIEPDLLDQIVAAAQAAGLTGPDRHIEQEGPDFVADAGATIITVVTGGGRHVTTVDALFEVDAGSPERRALADFVRRLERLRADADATSAYEPTAVEVFVAAVDEVSIPDPLLLDRVPWPFSDPLAEWGNPRAPDGLSVDVRCRVLHDDELELLEELRGYTAATVLVQDGEERIVAWRPLLPDRTGC